MVSRLDIQRILPGHHALDIAPDCVNKVRDAFVKLVSPILDMQKLCEDMMGWAGDTRAIVEESIL